MKYRSIITSLVFAAASLPLLAMAEDEAPELNADGLQLVEKDSRGAIYADPDADWSQFSKVMLDEATVAFRRNWERDLSRGSVNRVRSSDIERIKTGLAELFNEVFATELGEKGGYEIVDTAGPDVLRIAPHIIDLDIYAPDLSSSMNSRSYVRSAGRMTLKLQLIDSETGDLIAEASDRRQAPDRGYAQWANRVSNTAEARNMLKSWAKALRVRLNEATGTPVAE
ncbi:MAG: DUF3313 family protein [Xanthomonadales bacterium]|nr:DUF3313 family protein [Xanthomonadales bacterium]